MHVDNGIFILPSTLRGVQVDNGGLSCPLCRLTGFSPRSKLQEMSKFWFTLHDLGLKV